jgi:hypothetical protein
MSIGFDGYPFPLQGLSRCTGGVAPREGIKYEIIFTSEELYKKFCQTQMHSCWVRLEPFLTAKVLILVV